MSDLQLIKHSNLLYYFFLVGVLLLDLTTPCKTQKTQSPLKCLYCNSNNYRATTNGSIRCIEKERKALLQLFPKCIQPTSDDCCKWSGVYCNQFTGRIYRLDIDESFLPDQYEFTSDCEDLIYFHLHPSLLALEDLLYLSIGFVSQNISPLGFIGSFSKLRSLRFSSFGCGVIPPQLGNLTTLQSLEINYYGFSYDDEFCVHARNSEWLSHLTSLKRLILQGIDLSDARDLIHVISNLPSLTHLDLSNSLLSTFLNSHFSSTNSSKSLAFVDLSNTQLKSSPSMWTWLSNHSSSLIQLYLSSNELSGQIPLSFRNMTTLCHLDLSSNQLEGKFQLSAQGLCSLQTLDLSRNKLTGDLSSIFDSVYCAKSSNLVILNLRHNQFIGSIPNLSVFRLCSLQTLDLSRNNLTGDLSSILDSVYCAKSSNLVILNLRHNQFIGSIPNLSVFRSLKILQLKNNQLDGTIHVNLGLLSSLEIFDISSNSLKGYIYEAHFTNLSSLQYLDMSFNSLTFNISSDWVAPFRLRTIGLSSCKLGSRFPQWLQTQRNYSRLDMSNAGISDTFPFWFWNLSSSTTFIALSHNNLYGMLPNSSLVFTQKPSIDLSFNLLEGGIPSFLSNAAYLNLSRNSFSGSISFLCQRVLYYYDLFGLESLDLSHNFLSGKLPNCWSNRYFDVIDLSSNYFFGNIPRSFGSLTYLEILHLRDNLFSGKLSSSLTRSFNLLLSLDLGDNLFFGDLPTWIGQMQHMTVLSLRNNRFSGRIPLQLCNLSAIQILDLSKNNISGSIPHCLCNLTSMTLKKAQPVITLDSNGSFASIGGFYQDYINLALKGSIYEFTKHLELVKSIDLSSNRLDGEIPAEISCLSGLISLNISRNNLSGYITPKIGRLKSLESLDLSDNTLCGQIPATLTDLNFLGTLSLANNNLSGRIPTGTQIQGFDASVFAGNQWLCGDPLPKKCIGDIQNHQNLKHKDRVVSLGLYISIVLGFITGFWVVCGVLVLNKSLRYAFFGFWDHMYAKIHAITALNLAIIRRQFQT